MPMALLDLSQRYKMCLFRVTTKTYFQQFGLIEPYFFISIIKLSIFYMLFIIFYYIVFTLCFYTNNIFIILNLTLNVIYLINVFPEINSFLVAIVKQGGYNDE